MKDGKLSRGMSHIDDDLIIAAMDDSDLNGENGHLKRRKGMKLNTLWKKLAAAVAMLAIVVSVGFAVAKFAGVGSGGAVVAIDVNPSIEIEVDSKERVTDVDALNEDAEALLRGMELEGVTLDAALTEIMNVLIAEGYITTDKNSVLISVDADERTAKKLKNKLTEDVGAILGGSSIEASVLTQDLDRDDAIEAIAHKYGISCAKASLIYKIVASELLDANGVPYTYDSLAPLNVNELKLILDSKKFEVSGVEQNGNASIGDYITSDEAVAIAFGAAKLTSSNVSAVEVEMDFDRHHGGLVYEVEFIYEGNEYDYEISAKNGEVLYSEKEPCREHNVSGGHHGEHEGHTSDCKFIDRSAALESVYAHAGISADAVLRPEVELELENDLYVYEIEFKTAENEYEYTVNAVTGAILDSEVEPND